MKNFSLIICLILFAFILKAQNTFQITYGGIADDEGRSVMQTNDGGYVVVGYTKSIGDSMDVYLIKTNAIGDTTWTKTFGGSSTDEGYSAQQTFDNGYIIAGVTKSFGAGNSDVYLIKTDINGNALWAKTYGGADQDGGLSVKQTADSGFIIAGYTYSFGAGGGGDFYLIKTNADGDTLWTKTYGGNSTENAYDVEQTTDGGYIVTGFTSLGSGNFDAYIVKTDFAGNTQWGKKYGGASHDYGYAIKQTSDGGYIMTGQIGTFANHVDLYLIKTNSLGDTLWTKSYGDIGLYAGFSVKQTADNGYIIAGIHEIPGTGGVSFISLIKTDTIGDTLWTRTFDGINSGVGRSVQQTTDGGYIITGSFRSIQPNSNYEVYLIKCNITGSACLEIHPPIGVASTTTNVVVPATITSSTMTLTDTAAATISSAGGIATSLCSTTGIYEMTRDNLFLISPNPSTGEFNISFERTIMKGEIEIINLLGEIVYIQNITDEINKGLYLKNIPKGIYFVKVTDGLMQSTNKLIIE